MEECSLDYFFKIRDRPFGCLVGGGGAVNFFQHFKTRFLFSDKVEAFIFCNHRTSLYIWYEALLRTLYFSVIK